MEDYIKTSLFEHRFWLQILGDHSRFILNSLAIHEINEIEEAEILRNIFDALLERAQRDLSKDEIILLTRQAHIHACELRAFKLHLLTCHITGNISLQLPPTFINHMIDELEEYIRVMNFILNGMIPEAHPIHHHKLWLLDAEGHASFIGSDIDMVEKDIIKKSKEFEKEFGALYKKAVEFGGYLRTGIANFPALQRLNIQAECKIQLFMEFLKELQESLMEKKILGTLSPLGPDHMYREECYYLTRLARASGGEMPDCNPDSPRIEV